MLKASEIIGKKIINRRNQVTSYTVGEGIYDSRDYRIVAFRLNTSKKTRMKSFLPLNKINDVTARAVIIPQVDEIIRLEDDLVLQRICSEYKSFIGFEVYNNTSDLLGVVKDYQFDLKTGEIISFIISEGFFSDITTGYSLLPSFHSIDFEKNNIIINEEESQIYHTSAGLKKLLGIEDRI